MTKIPFFISVLSVIVNIFISVYFFSEIGFIIIPIATTISSWLNAIILLVYLSIKGYFLIKLELIKSFLKISLSSVLTSYIFYILVNYFSNKLTYNSEYKLMTIILLVIIIIIIYILISIITKAFKISDIKLKY